MSVENTYLKQLKEIITSRYAKKIEFSNTSKIKQNIFNRRSGMIDRCYNPKNASYHEYGRRGICVCDEWRESSLAYLEWVCKELAGFAYKFESVAEAMSILEVDRIDPNGNYTPQNCRLLEREYNNYTTISPSRCAMYQGLYIPFWYIEKILGIQRVGKDSKGISDRIACVLNRALKGKSYYGTQFMFLKPNMNSLFNKRWAGESTKKELLESVTFLVWYNFHKNPLEFSKDTLLSDCPSCQKHAVDIIKENAYTLAKCQSCDFSEILIKADYTQLPNIYEDLRSLPLKTFDKNIQTFIKENAENVSQKKISQQTNYFKRKLRIISNPELQKAQKEKDRFTSQKHHAKKQIEAGVPLDKVRKIDKFKKVPIWDLKTRKAVRERLKKEAHLMTPQEIKKARALMTKLLKVEKENAKKRNPAGYYARLKRMNDARTKRIRGEGYEIKPRQKNQKGETPLYLQHTNTPAKPRKKAQRLDYKKIYFTQDELANFGFDKVKLQQKYKDRLANSFSPNIHDLKKERELVESFLSKRHGNGFVINYQGTPIVWDNKNEYTFCKCKKGVFKLDFENECTTSCTECGLKLGFNGYSI